MRSVKEVIDDCFEKDKDFPSISIGTLNSNIESKILTGKDLNYLATHHDVVKVRSLKISINFII